MNLLGYQACHDLIRAAFPDQGRADGRDLVLDVGGVAVTVRATSNQRSHGLRIRAFIGQAPIRVWLSSRNTFLLSGPPPLATGDADFDARWRLLAAPQGLVTAALDPEFRALISRCFPKGSEMVIRDNMVQVNLPGSSATAATLRDVVWAVGRFARRCDDVYRAGIADARRMGGDLAAQARQSAWQAEADAVARTERVGQFITLLFVAVLLLVIFGGVGLSMFHTLGN